MWGNLLGVGFIALPIDLAVAFVGPPIKLVARGVGIHNCVVKCSGFILIRFYTSVNDVVIDSISDST